MYVRMDHIHPSIHTFIHTYVCMYIYAVYVNRVLDHDVVENIL